MIQRSVSQTTLRRLPRYLGYLKSLAASHPETISATVIANALEMGEVQVRKDLASVCSGGRPKVGYSVPELIASLEDYLGYNDVEDAIVFGAGKLGRALLDYGGFQQYGVNIIAAFDSDPEAVGKTSAGKQIFGVEKFPDLCTRLQIQIGIIAVPAEAAQEICDLMVSCGIKAILNYAPIHLTVPDGIILQNENIAVAVASLSRKLREQNIKQ